MSECKDCKLWVTRHETIYEGNGEVIVNWRAPPGKGKCTKLDFITEPDFGCKYFKKGGPSVETKTKSGEPWQHSIGGPCPDCKKPECGHPNCTYIHCPGMNRCIGTGSTPAGIDDRCYGTGGVSYYDDGYIGDVKTRMHPKELALLKKEKCPKCNFKVQDTWVACPNCGLTLKEQMANTEIIELKGF